MSQHTFKLTVIYPQCISTIQKPSKKTPAMKVLMSYEDRIITLFVLTLLVNIEAHFYKFEINQKHVLGHHSKFRHNNDA